MPTKQLPTLPSAGLSATDRKLCLWSLQMFVHKFHKYSAYLSGCEHGCFLFLLVLLQDKQYSGKIVLVGSLASLAELKSFDSASEPRFCKDFLHHSTIKWGATRKIIAGALQQAQIDKKQSEMEFFAALLNILDGEHPSMSTANPYAGAVQAIVQELSSGNAG